MNVAYVISAYKAPDQLVRLVRRLRCDGVSFTIHVDARTAKPTFRRMVDGLDDLDSVTFVERHVCRWGDFGHVRATLKGIDHIVRNEVPFDYVVLLTGQDYPLESPSSIARFLTRSAGRSFMSHWPLPRAAWSGRGGLDRIERWHVVGRNRAHLSLPARRRLPAALEPYGGSPYWCLARTAVEHVHAFVAANPDVVRFFEHVHIPDELFFQTILLNSPCAATLVNDDLRYVDWSSRPAPRILTCSDLPALLACGKLFARKFDASVDADVLSALDERIDGRLQAVAG